MAKIQGTNVAAPLAPFTTDDQFPTHDAKYGKGGQREVATIAERDAIPSARLTEGCTCYVAATEKTYRWKSNTWVEDTPQDGSDGKSAYQLYCDTVPEGEEPKSEQEWLASLKGDKGDDGDDGKSAYQVYLDNVPSGETPMTEAQWLASLKGEKGDKGVQGDTLVVDGANTYKLYHELGQNNDGAVDQKTLTNLFVDVQSADVAEDSDAKAIQLINGKYAESHSDGVKVRGLGVLTNVLEDYVVREEENDVVYPSTKVSGVIPQGGKWVSKSLRWSYMIPHTYRKGDVMIITANSSQPASWAFLTSDSHVAGQDVDFANTATGWTSVAKNTTAHVEIPSTCTFILIYEKWDATSVLPSSLKIKSFIPHVDEDIKRDVEELKQRRVVSLYDSIGTKTDGAITQRLFTESLYEKLSLDIANFEIVKCNIYQGKWNDVGSSARKTIFVPLEDGHTYTLIATATCYYALVTDTNVVANQTPAFVDGYTDKRTLSAGGTLVVEGVAGQFLWVRDDVLSFQIEVRSDDYLGLLSKDADIIDDLNSDDSEKVLSARQGKVLNESVNSFGNTLGEMPNIFHLGAVLLGKKQASTWTLSKNFENGTITFHCNSADASVYAWMDFSVFPFVVGRKYRLEFDFASTLTGSNYGTIYFSNQHASISSNIQWSKVFGENNVHFSQDFTFMAGYIYLFTTAAGTGAGKEMVFSNIKVTELSALPLLTESVRNISDVDAATHVCEYAGQPIPRPTNRIGFSRYMPVHTTGAQGWYMQGCAAYDKWLFDIDEGFDRINVYDLEKREFHSTVVREATGHHCNTAMFTNIFLDDGDDFPLMLVSGTSGNPISYLCKVTFVNNVFSIDIIQTITYPSSLAGGQLKIDNDRGYYWACGISSFKRFAIPAIKDGNGDIIPTASLSSEDVLEVLTVTHKVTLESMQGGIIVNGWHYCGYGVPSLGNKIYFVAINLYDADTEPIVINLTEVYHPSDDYYEPEGVFVYDGHLFISFKNYGFVKVHL